MLSSFPESLENDAGGGRRGTCKTLKKFERLWVIIEERYDFQRSQAMSFKQEMGTSISALLNFQKNSTALP